MPKIDEATDHVWSLPPNLPSINVFVTKHIYGSTAISDGFFTNSPHSDSFMIRVGHFLDYTSDSSPLSLRYTKGYIIYIII